MPEITITWLLLSIPIQMGLADSPQLFYHDCGNSIPPHTKGATDAIRVGFELATDGIQFYAFGTNDPARRCTHSNFDQPDS